MRNRLIDGALCAALAFAPSALSSTATAARTRPATAPYVPVNIRIIGPTPSRQLVMSRITVMLNRGKSPVNNAKVSIDLSMPDMSMPKTVVVCRSSSPGVYDAACTFTMSGAWQIETFVQCPNGKSATVINHVIIQ